MQGRVLGLWLIATCLLVLALPAAAGAKLIDAQTILPPGQSGHVSIPGVVSGTGSPHLTDQVDPFINFQFKDSRFNRPGDTETPRPGLRIVRDRWGVPAITGDTDELAMWGVGYAVAQDRAFEIELFRRAGNGTLAEVVGPSFLDDDLIARRDYFTDEELDRQIAKIPHRLRVLSEAYVDGVNTWMAHLRANPLEMPGEFAALLVQPPTITIRDVARTGILLARTVPSGDGNELANARALMSAGPKAFEALHPVRTSGRIATVPRAAGRFEAQPGRTRADERKGFAKTRKWLKRVDLDTEGPGTLPLGARSIAQIRSMVAGEAGEDAGADLRRLLPTGGSYMWAVRNRSDSETYLFNGPQLGFSIPELFIEWELHSPSYDVRGATAPLIPLIGIGYTKHAAWGFTSGLSDEDDLYAERLVGPESYRYKGRIKRMECRDEIFNYRSPPTDIPGLIEEGDLGGLAGSVGERICRTVHGPVQTRSDGWAFARRYAIWGRELETIVGLTKLPRARSVKDIDRAMRTVTWNENLMAIDDRGGIGYWHPGLHPLKPVRWDERLPFPGDGRAEWRGLLPRSRTPHVVNPKRNWLANWNNPPSVGWTNGDGVARERLTGNLHRVRWLASLVRRLAKNPSYSRSRKLDRRNGTHAQQWAFADRRKLRQAIDRADGDGRRAIRRLLSWAGDYHRTDAEGTVHPGVAIWEELKDQLELIYLNRFKEGAEILAGGTGSSHEFDTSNGEAHALRRLGAKAYARAATRTAAVLTVRFGTENAKSWREPRRMYDWTVQGAGAPPDLPFFDRGTYEQSVGLK